MIDRTTPQSVVTAALTGFVASIPGEVMPYVLKVAGVFALAVVAELGRQAVLWIKKKVKK